MRSVEFMALGSCCRIDVWTEADRTQPEALVDSAIDFIADLEKHWSRFDEGSDVSRLNRAAGSAVSVSALTIDLVATAIAAWEFTDGLFDPTVGAAMLAAGYDRTFDEVAGRDLSVASGAVTVPGCGAVSVNRRDETIVLASGTILDLGGIGKGRAADLAVAHLLAHGARSACVDLGGDLRMAGPAPIGDRWVIEVDDPDAPGRTMATLAIADSEGRGGAVATSSVSRRQWRTTRGAAHHLIDPTTGRPSMSGVVSATVIAADATSAEVLAKAAVIAGPERGRDLIADSGAAGLLVVRTADSREFVHAGNLAGYLVEDASREDVHPLSQSLTVAAEAS